MSSAGLEFLLQVETPSAPSGDSSSSHSCALCSIQWKHRGGHSKRENPSRPGPLVAGMILSSIDAKRAK